MSDLPTDESLPAAPPPNRRRSFVFHAKLIGGITLLSRLLGLARESIAARYFGAGAVWSAFTFAFTIPNLFRKLFGEGALSAAFIPLYAASVRRDSPEQARRFAAASVNLLVAILVVLTIVGELVLLAIALLVHRPDYVLALQLAAIMLPYVLLVCGAAFLGAILQVHDRFAETAATSIVLNLCLIVTIAIAAGRFDLSTDAGQRSAVIWLAIGVVVSGVLQLAILLPALRAVGFRFDPLAPIRTPAVKKMLLMSIPVAIGASVLQLGVLLDKAIAFFLAEAEGATHFTLLGTTIAYPMAEGAAARLNWAQFMYQFPLGVFAIALATAIFPRLSSDAASDSPLSRGSAAAAATPEFRSILRRGVEASLFIGLPASAGMIVVRDPAVRLLFEGGHFTRSDSEWVALSTAIYSAAIWAFSLQQILNRAYYALHDTLTPLVWTVVNLLLNLVIELPLLWTPLRESGIAVGTLVSFAIQSVVMLWMLDRRAGGLGLGGSVSSIAKMTIATAVMWVACYATLHAPIWRLPEGKTLWASQLAALMLVGALVYFGTCALLGVGEWRRYLPGARRSGSKRDR
jgi:putative peptidoglycan lipid II flippase